MNSESITPGNKISMTVAFGKQRYSTTFKQISTNIITWQDPLRMQRSTEETISIKFFSFDSSYNEEIIGSVVLPIQTVISKGNFTGSILLVNKGITTVKLYIDMNFDEKYELNLDRSSFLYPNIPQANIHAHAFNIPIDFTHTPPAYCNKQINDRLEFD